MRKLNKLFGLLLVFVLGFTITSAIKVKAETTVEASFSGPGTDGEASVETFGLDPQIFEKITYIKHDATNELYIKANEIRLYSVRETGKGAELVFEIKNEYKISGIEFTTTSSSYAPKTAIYVNGVLDSTHEEYGTNLKIDNVFASSISIQNVHEGGSKNTQLRIESLKITYKKAQEDLVESIDGASIRTSGVQGLRFDAKVLNIEAIKEKGFYLIFGKASIDDLNEAILNKDGETIILNGKEVFRKAVPGTTLDDEFSIVLTGIPGRGYLDNITVIPYAVGHDDVEMLVSPVTRSIGEVAIKIHDSGLTVPEGILDEFNNYTRVRLTDTHLEVLVGLMDNGNLVNVDYYDFYHNEDVTSITLPVPPEKEGYEFKHYLLNGVTYEAQSEYTLSGVDVLLELVYEELAKRTVVFVTDGGTPELDSIELLPGALIPVPTSPIKEGYTFDGWYKENTHENLWDFDNDVMPDYDITLYAKWIEKIIEPEKEVLYTTDFETAGNKTGYAKGTIEDGNFSWTLDQALIGNDASDKRNGSYGIRIRSIGEARINQSFESLSEIEFHYAHFGTLTLGRLKLQISLDNETWITIWTSPNGQVSALTKYNVIVDYSDGSLVAAGITDTSKLFVRWYCDSGSSGNNTHRQNLDDITIYSLK